MRLTRLEIARDGVLIRKIEFKDGLNLILDEPTNQSTQSGNNVGKTTVLRLIDYCLGSDGDDIWTDSEFKQNINQDVFDFLHGSAVVSVSLFLRRSSIVEHQLRRIFRISRRGTPVHFVDNVPQRNLSDYRQAVKELLFGSSGSKPSLRQLAPKFVRSSQNLMSKTLKVLGDYGSASDYEALHLFLFGFFAVEVLSDRPRLTKLKTKLARDLETLVRSRKEGEIEQLLLHLRREIEQLDQQGRLREEVPEIALKAAAVAGIRANASNIAANLGRLEGEIAGIGLTMRELDSEYENIDRSVIESIYREALRYIPKLQHDWAELADFIQNLRQRKQRFLETQAHALSLEADRLKVELGQLQASEAREIGSLIDSPTFSEALALRSELQDKLKRLGSLEQDLQDIRDLKSKINSADLQLQQTKQQIDDGKELLGKRVAIFNKYFSEISKTLYGEQYLLHYDETAKGALSFQLSSVGSNVGAGKKLSQTAAFDLAYIEFLRESGIGFPRFVCHDGVESVHANQLTALLFGAAAIEGQLILSTLRDKLPEMPGDFIKEHTVLTLSQNNKLFGI